MHTGGEGKHRTPQAKFKRLVNKNTIKLEIGRPPWQFFLKALAPQGFWQKLELPLPWIFNPSASMRAITYFRLLS
jgi:hypothetical protein